MTLNYRHPVPAFAVECVIEDFMSEGADLDAVTLDEFKRRLKHTIRWMVDEFNATTIWPHRGGNFLQSA